MADILHGAFVTKMASEPDALTRQRLRAQIDPDNPGTDVLVAEHPERGVLGVVTINWTDNLRLGLDAFIADLFVHEDARGEGAGSALVDAAKNRAARAGAVRVLLYTGRSGPAASRAFYEKQGFERRDDVAVYLMHVPPGGDAD